MTALKEILRSFTHLVIMYDPFSESLVQHLFVPLLKPLWFWDLLVGRVAVENIVISFTRWAGPDVTSHIPNGPQSKNYNTGSKVVTHYDESNYP